jgi:hypothetical protein
MKSDIEHPEVTGIAMAVVRELNEEGNQVWNVYMLNLKAEEITNVLVSSSGYGQRDGEPVKTSVLRHFLGDMNAESATKVEPIVEDVFGINNEYWISFYIGKAIFDKRYVFLAETIREEYFTTIPVLNKQGVMIK